MNTTAIALCVAAAIALYAALARWVSKRRLRLIEKLMEDTPDLVARYTWRGLDRVRFKTPVVGGIAFRHSEPFSVQNGTKLIAARHESSGGGYVIVLSTIFGTRGMKHYAFLCTRPGVETSVCQRSEWEGFWCGRISNWSIIDMHHKL